MKKIYNDIELEIISLVAEDVITTSDPYGYDPDGSVGNNNNDSWEW